MLRSGSVSTCGSASPGPARREQARPPPRRSGPLQSPAEVPRRMQDKFLIELASLVRRLRKEAADIKSIGDTAAGPPDSFERLAVQLNDLALQVESLIEGRARPSRHWVSAHRAHESPMSRSLLKIGARPPCWRQDGKFAAAGRSRHTEPSFVRRDPDRRRRMPCRSSVDHCADAARARARGDPWSIGAGWWPSRGARYRPMPACRGPVPKPVAVARSSLGVLRVGTGVWFRLTSRLLLEISDALAQHFYFLEAFGEGCARSGNGQVETAFLRRLHHDIANRLFPNTSSDRASCTRRTEMAGLKFAGWS